MLVHFQTLDYYVECCVHENLFNEPLRVLLCKSLLCGRAQLAQLNSTEVIYALKKKIWEKARGEQTIFYRVAMTESFT